MGYDNVTTAYVTAYVLVCLVSAVSGLTIIMQLTPDVGREEERQTFGSFITFFIIYTMTNAVNVFCNTYHYPEVGTVFSIANEAAIMICVFEWFVYIEVILGGKVATDRRVRSLASIPIIFMILLLLSTPFTHLVFGYVNGTFVRGPFYITILVVSFVYVIYASVHVFLNIKSNETMEQRKRNIMLMMFIIFPLMAGFVDLFIPHLPIMEMMCLLGIIMVFTSMQQSNIFIDNLTGINNRRSADEYLNRRISDAGPDNPVAFFMSDIDNFKRINDRYGHTEGDNALKIVADSLKAFAIENECHVSRWGGDEFVLICSGDPASDPENVKARLDKMIDDGVDEYGAGYDIKMSVGYAVTTDCNTKLSAFIEAADKEMYKVKKSRSTR